MIIQLLSWYQLTVQKMGGTYRGRTFEPELYGAYHAGYIGTGETQIEAIKNCMSAMDKDKK